jgi:hypothetical protein
MGFKVQDSLKKWLFSIVFHATKQVSIHFESTINTQHMILFLSAGYAGNSRLVHITWVLPQTKLLKHMA